MITKKLETPEKAGKFPPSDRPLWKKEPLCFLPAFLIMAGCTFLFQRHLTRF